MNIVSTAVCPGTLASGFDTYSPIAAKSLFKGKKISHQLPYNEPSINDNDTAKFIANRKRLSISGVQEKVSMILDGKHLRLTEEGEQGTYILKPIPRDLLLVNQVPANEHLTMQIARQVFGINTAHNALIFFKNGAPAYLTKRFDITNDGRKLGMEDFASLAGKTSENAGADFKYEYSYEEIAELIKKFVSAYPIEVEKYFSLVLFNYLFLNGDAHLKNFSLLESPNKDYLLSPAYDLINTRLHVEDSRMALKGGLFKNDFETESYTANGFYAFDDFLEFGIRIGIREERVRKSILSFHTNLKPIISLVRNSFLSNETKKEYFHLYKDRLKAIKYSYSGKI